jgi:hypothetical protein
VAPHDHNRVDSDRTADGLVEVTLERSPRTGSSRSRSGVPGKAPLRPAKRQDIGQFVPESKRVGAVVTERNGDQTASTGPFRTMLSFRVKLVTGEPPSCDLGRGPTARMLAGERPDAGGR